MKTALEIYSDKLMAIMGDLCNQFTTEQTLKSHYLLKEMLELEKQQIIDAYNESDKNSVGKSVSGLAKLPNRKIN